MSLTFRKQRLLERIALFSKTEQHEIFRMLVAHNVPYTVNQNGVFFNMVHVSEAILDEVEHFVDFYTKNKTELDAIEQRITEFKHSKDHMQAPTCDATHPQSSSAVLCNHRMTSSGKTCDALLMQAPVQRATRTRQVSKFMLAKKRFAKKQSAAESRNRLVDVCESEDILEPDEYCLPGRAMEL